MKKKILLLISVVCFSITSIMAQEKMQRQTPEEKTKTAMEKMAALNLDDDSKTKTQEIIFDFYTAQQNAIKEMRASGEVNREAVQAKRKELAEARDAKLKLLFKEEQYKKWISEIEPSLRPQRPAN